MRVTSLVGRLQAPGLILASRPCSYFSRAVSTDSNRRNLANKMLAIYNQYSLDGIDIDWEYPAKGGIDSNGRSPDDSKNYLKFLVILRELLPAGAKITAATQVWPFASDDWQGSPMTDVRGFADVFDWITIMNYDVWGSASSHRLPLSRVAQKLILLARCLASSLDDQPTRAERAPLERL